MKIGIMGAGNIAGTMARTLNAMTDATAYAVASRDMKKAEQFAKEFQIPKAYGSYEDMLADPEVDLIYVATPHSHHYEHMKLCLAYKKAILCEKPFTQNATQAEEIFKLAEKKRIFVAEAVWTRFHPMVPVMKDILKSGVIGQPVSLTGTFSCDIDHIRRVWDPNLAGGILLDCGIYPLTFANMFFGKDYTDIASHAIYAETGVDLMIEASLSYPDGRIAHIHSDARMVDDHQGKVCGSKGYIIYKDLLNCKGIEVYDDQQRLVASYDAPEQINGYEYEVRSCVKALQEGKLECPEIPHAETLHMMGTMDRIRKDRHIIYPNEV